MAATINVYSAYAQHLNEGTIDPNSDQFLITLHTSGYTPNTNGHAQFSDLTNEYSTTQFGYTAGGLVVANGLIITRSGNITTADLADFTLLSSGGTLPAWRYYVVRANVSRNGFVGPLAFWGLGNDTGGGTDVAAKVDGASWTLRWNVNGAYRVQV